MNRPLLKRSDLRKTQWLMHEKMMEARSRWIISGMGSGKTGSTLTVMRDLLDSTAINHWLVIAPWFVAKYTWPTEIESWEHLRCLRYEVAVGDAEERAAAIEAKSEITFINFENLPWLARHIGTVQNWYWDGLIIDETSRFKSGAEKTKVTKILDDNGRVVAKKGGRISRFGVVSVALPKIERAYGLTGTPFPTGVIDAWGQVYPLDGGKRLGRKISHFRNRWFRYDRYKRTYFEKPKAEEDIMAAIKDIAVVIPTEKVTEDPIFIDVPVDLPPKALKAYRKFQRELVSTEYDVEAVNRGVLANKLLQFANGSMYREDQSVVEIHDAKLKALEELSEQAGDQSMLILYNYKFDKDRIKKRWPDAVVANEEDDIIRRWNNGDIKKLLAHPASIGHGTNLQYGGHLSFWYGLPWSLELYEQANLRLPRPGQKNQVYIYQIVARDTYDMRVVQTLSDRGVTEESLKQSLVEELTV